MISALVLILVSAIAFWYFQICRDMKNRPPGPFQLPVIGNILQVAASSSFPAHAFDKLSKKYGKIMSLRMGNIKCIVLSDYENIRELFSGDNLLDRDVIDVLKDRNMHRDLGLIWASGPPWSTVRAFSVRNLRTFGFGKTSSMETIVMNEIEGLVEDFERTAEKNNGIFSMKTPFLFSTFNIIWSFATGVHFGRHNSQKLKDLIELSNQFVKSTNFAMSITLAFPILRSIFPRLSGKCFQLKAINELHEFLRDTVQEHKTKEGRKDNPQSFIDVFINQIEAEKHNPESFFTEDQLIITFLDLFQAGSETTAEVLNFGFLYLILNPQVQKKVQDEIDEIIPSGTLPSLEYRPKMVYTQATIYEMLRCGNILPLPAARKAQRDFYYKGYLFEKGIAVFSNLHSVFTNEKFWGDPKIFRPERYIKANGQLDLELTEKASAVFGHGKRYCIGDTLALSTLFLMITTMLQRMTFSQVPGKSSPTTEPILGMSMTPHPYEVLITPRKQRKQ